MNTAGDDLFKNNLWNYFREISAIPRESGHEAGVQEYLLAFAGTHQFESIRDAAGNIIIKVPASKGKENVAPLAFQGHMDMVCVKGEGSDHDFEKDGITLIREGDHLMGDNTTLGADNGIAIALMLDLFTDPEVKHGPLEGIFTVEEETGLTGAFALEAKHVASRRLINLDSEEEGIFYIGCAGGNEVDGEFTLDSENTAPEEKSYHIEVSGLMGGHSGAEIHTQRGNAIKIMARILSSLEHLSPVRIVSINGGTRRNVIPSSCRAHIVSQMNGEDMEREVAEAADMIAKELSYVEDSLSVSVTPGKQASAAYSKEGSSSLIRSLILAPHGVLRMSEAIEGVVETSANLAIVSSEQDTVRLVSSHRSSVESSRDYAAELTEAAVISGGGRAARSGAYPAWTPNPASPLAAFCAKAYRDSVGKEPVITAIHAGLECGIINDRIEGMDSVSLGPDLEGVHSIKEKVSISSTERVGAFIRHLCSIV